MTLNTDTIMTLVNCLPIAWLKSKASLKTVSLMVSLLDFIWYFAGSHVIYKVAFKISELQDSFSYIHFSSLVLKYLIYDLITSLKMRGSIYTYKF